MEVSNDRWKSGGALLVLQQYWLASFIILGIARLAKLLIEGLSAWMNQSGVLSGRLVEWIYGIERPLDGLRRYQA